MGVFEIVYLNVSRKTSSFCSFAAAAATATTGAPTQVLTCVLLPLIVVFSRCFVSLSPLDFYL